MKARPRNPDGFVLVATLWVLAALAVLAAYIDGVVAADVERAVKARTWLESELGRAQRRSHPPLTCCRPGARTTAG